ncbi:LA_3751/LA_3752 family putative glycosyltransferase [Aerosakkonemataceae cyanobacterium BLCC-F154]|uniref:LA_3751/LA_3752 family putative glycosyltransferase n=1 Tax=Floridaenema fluviatile BLCC-F154 TaxID=3153640 RepID=A0ABV4YFB3_9CYAN
MQGNQEEKHPVDNSELGLSQPRKEVQFAYIPWIVLGAGILFSLFWQLLVPYGHFFSGDGALKALLAQQWSAGDFRFDLDLPAASWVKTLWQKGLYPFEEPFVYLVKDVYYITFPFTFPVLTAPFHALSGYRGLYFVPLVATWAIWLNFYWVCRRLKLNDLLTALGLVVLIFASPLTFYSATYWEHNLAIALSFYGMSTLLVPGKQGLSKKDAIFSGVAIGLSVWFREEIVIIVGFFCLLVYAAYFFRLRRLKHLAENKELIVISMILSVGGFFLLNLFVYHHPLGIHSIQVVKKFSLLERLQVTAGNLKIFLVGENFNQWYSLLYTFPLVLFPIIYLVGYFWKPQKLKLTLRAKIVYLLCLLFPIAVAFLVPAGGGGKQWSPRFLLVLIPLIILVTIGELRFLKRISQPVVRNLSYAGFFLLLMVSFWLNTITAPRYFVESAQRIQPAIDFLRSHPNQIVAVSHQYVAQSMMPAMEEKLFFLSKNQQSLGILGKELNQQKINEFAYVCYPYQLTELCKTLAKKPKSLLTFPEQNFTLAFSELGKYGTGKYAIYQAELTSLKSSLPEAIAPLPKL